MTKKQHEEERMKFHIKENDSHESHIEAYSKRLPIAEQHQKDADEAREKRIFHQEALKENLDNKEYSDDEVLEKENRPYKDMSKEDLHKLADKKSRTR